MRNQNKLQKNRDFLPACVYVLTSVYLAYAHRTNKNIQNLFASNFVVAIYYTQSHTNNDCIICHKQFQLP